MIRRTRKKIWALHRLREAGASKVVLKVNYETKIRSILEYGNVVWGFVISGLQANEFKKIQMNAVQVILGAESKSYVLNLQKLEMERLDVRREDQIRKFAISSFKDPVFRSWYEPTPQTLRPERDKGFFLDKLGHIRGGEKPSTRLIVPSVRLARTEKMPLCSYTKVLNDLTGSEWKELGLPPISSCQHRRNVQLSGLFHNNSHANQRQIACQLDSLPPPSSTHVPSCPRAPPNVDDQNCCTNPSHRPATSAPAKALPSCPDHPNSKS